MRNSYVNINLFEVTLRTYGFPRSSSCSCSVNTLPNCSHQHVPNLHPNHFWHCLSAVLRSGTSLGAGPRLRRRKYNQRFRFPSVTVDIPMSSGLPSQIRRWRQTSFSDITTTPYMVSFLNFVCSKCITNACQLQAILLFVRLCNCILTIIGFLLGCTDILSPYGGAYDR